jgi:hypothetical protein
MPLPREFESLTPEQQAAVADFASSPAAGDDAEKSLIIMALYRAMCMAPMAGVAAGFQGGDLVVSVHGGDYKVTLDQEMTLKIEV